MLFWSRLRNPHYVVVASDYDYFGPNGRNRKLVPGIAADFVPLPGNAGSQFDSEAAQRAFRWDDETREMVEQHLLSHADFGHEIHLLSEPDPGQAPAEPAKSVCMLMIPGAEGVRVCGQATAPGSPFCPEHQLQIEGNPEPGTDDRGRPVPASVPEAVPAPPAGAIPSPEAGAVAVLERDDRDERIAQLEAELEAARAAASETEEETSGPGEA